MSAPLKARVNEFQAILVRLLGNPLHNWNELHKAAADLLEEAIDFEGMVGIFILQYSQSIELDLVFFEHFKPGHDPVVGRFLPFVHPVVIVKLTRPVNRKTHQKIVFTQEFSPLVI